MPLCLFNNNIKADLSGEWKLSRILTPFVTGPEDKRSTKNLAEVFNVLYCLSVVALCILSFLYKGTAGLIVSFFIFAVCGALIQAVRVTQKRKAGRPASSVKSLEDCFRNEKFLKAFRLYIEEYLKRHDSLDGSFVYTAYEYFAHAKLFSPDLKSVDRFSRIMAGEYPLSYKDHQNIYLRSHNDAVWKGLEKLVINAALSNNGSTPICTDNICYWSSDKNGTEYAYRKCFQDGGEYDCGNDEKLTSSANYCRAVKKIYFNNK